LKHNTRILIFTIVILTALSLAACDATGAVSIEELTGVTSSNTTLADTSSTSRKVSAMSSDTGIDQVAMNDSSPKANLKLRGLVDDVTANSLTVNGATFTVNTTEDLTAYFESGMAYQLEYTVNEDNSISLVSFSQDDMNSSSDDDSYTEDEYEFYGMLEDVTENTLTFNGETFQVNTTEDLTTLFTAGEFYEIEYYLNADGTITIKSYSLEDNSDDSYDDDSEDSNDSYNDDDSYNNNDSTNNNDSYDNSNDDSSNDSNNNYNNDSSNNNNENNNEDSNNND